MIRRLPWVNLALLGASLLLVLLVLELAARTLSWRMGKGFWSRPNSFVSAFFVTYDHPPPLFDAGDGSDSGGYGTFRTGQRVPLHKDADELRVICLGGSTTVNARNREGLTYSREIQTALRPLFPDHRVFVLNAGSDAFSTAHSVTNLSLRLLDFEPDVITVYHAINDLSAHQFGDFLLPDYSNKYLDDAFLAYEHRSGFGGLVFRLSRGAQMVKWRLSVLRRMLERSSRGQGVSNAERGPEIFERNLRSIVALARAHGAEPVLATQAHAHGVAAENGRFEPFNHIVRQLGNELGVPVVDAAAALGGRAEHFLDPVHLTSEGVRALGAELTPAVAERLRQRLARDERPARADTIADPGAEAEREDEPS